mmetsp:Transcript_2531/g.4589  ORF Transcript_2531/g.4589 Transcript_2531/m.4589 type:complete len:707 (+) Transcript_2531:49-2169(+)
MAVSFFGLAATLDPTTTLTVFVGLVICLILFEHSLEEIEVLAEEAGYQELVKKVYKEMMIMGFLGFGVFMAFNVFPLEHDENFLAFEFVHLTVFFIGIILVLRALLAIYNSSRSSKLHWRAHNASFESILERIEEATTAWTFEGFCYRYLNLFSPLQHTINYKMLEEYFHKDFNISRVEFRFVDYLTKHNVYYAMELTEVSLMSWLAVIFVVILNYVRILVYDTGLENCTGAAKGYYPKYNKTSTAMDESQGDTSYEMERLLAGGDDAAEFHLTTECANFGSKYFVFCGGLLILFGFVVCIANYWSERKVAITGHYWTHEQQVSTLKNRLEEEAGRCLSVSGRALVEVSEEVWHVCSLRKVLEEKKIEEFHHHISQERRVKECMNSITGICWPNKRASRVQTVDAIKHLKLANKAKMKALDNKQESLKGKVQRAGAVGEEKDEHPLLFEYDDPMFFKSRKAHKFLIEVFQMLMALFIAMWATNYVFVSQHSSNHAVYVVVTMIQFVILLIQMSFLQDTACSLLAVTSLVNEAAEMMCEEDHIKAKVLPIIRKEIEELTPEGMSLQDHLYNVYNFVNFDGDDNGIGLKEFSSLLFTVDLILPDNEVDILFRAVDSNGSGNIEFGELYELFHPNSMLVSKQVEDGDSRKMKMLSHQSSSTGAAAHSVPSKKKTTAPHAILPIEGSTDNFVDLESAGENKDDNVANFEA